MLCARRHIGSSVSEVNSPASMLSSRRLASPPVTYLSNRLWSQTSSARSTPERITRTPPGTVSLKIGPYSAAIWTKPSIGLCASMSKTLPTTGSPRGPGISSRWAVMLIGSLRGCRGWAGTQLVTEQHQAEQHHPSREDQHDGRMEGGADEEERGGEVAQRGLPAVEQAAAAEERGRGKHEHARCPDTEDEDHAVAHGGQRPGIVDRGHRGRGELRLQG